MLDIPRRFLIPSSIGKTRYTIKPVRSVFILFFLSHASTMAILSSAKLLDFREIT
jgi:hypothetical protein